MFGRGSYSAGDISVLGEALPPRHPWGPPPLLAGRLPDRFVPVACQNGAAGKSCEFGAFVASTVLKTVYTVNLGADRADDGGLALLQEPSSAIKSAVQMRRWPTRHITFAETLGKRYSETGSSIAISIPEITIRAADYLT